MALSKSKKFPFHLNVKTSRSWGYYSPLTRRRWEDYQLWTTYNIQTRFCLSDARKQLLHAHL